MKNTSLDTLLVQLANRVGVYFGSIQASPPRPIEQLRVGDVTNAVVVLYSPHGHPLQVVTLAESIGVQMRTMLVESAWTLGQLGVVATYRTVETGDEMIAWALADLMSDLFGMVLPFNVADDVPVARRGTKRQRMIKNPGGGSRKRTAGRPRKVAAGTEPTVKRGPGRPRKVAADAIPTVKRGPGRPRNNAPVKGTGTVKRGPGRPRKVADDAIPTVKRGPGRPRKNAGETAPTVKRRGRPRKATAAGVPTVKRGPGRPRKVASAATPTVKRGPGRPRKVADETAPTVKRLSHASD